MKKQPMTEEEQLIHNIKKHLMNSYYGRSVFKKDSKKGLKKGFLNVQNTNWVY